jgi:ParB family chromosome partitioning protein
MSERAGRKAHAAEIKAKRQTAVALAPDPSACEQYGRLCAGVHIGGYAFERALGEMEALLTSDKWMRTAAGFTDVNKFVASLRLDQFRIVAEQRKRIATKIKELQPTVSNRSIAKMVGVDEGTIRHDRAENSAGGPKTASKINGAKAGGAENSAALSGPEVAKLGMRGGAGFSTNRDLITQSSQNDWRTPRKYLDAARTVMGAIDLDPASGEEANETVKAAKIYTEADNGLVQPWKGRVWLNPPYGGEAKLFVERLLKEYQVGNVTAACVLLNSHPTETKWFQGLFDYLICFIHGRIHFGGPSRDVTSSATHGSVIVYLGQERAKFIKTFSEFGAVLVKAKSEDA